MSNNSFTTVVFRGATAFFATTFYDANGNVTQPSGAEINIVSSDPTGAPVQSTVTMAPPVSPNVVWIAEWDSRGAGPGKVSWSIHTAPPGPFSVEDGDFLLSANSANLLVF